MGVVNKIDVKHPKMFNPRKGSLQLIDGVSEINQSVAHILGTSVGELWGDPEFGCHLQEYLLTYTVTAAVPVIKAEIVRAITKYEPRVSISEDMITIIEHPNERSLEIRLVYQISFSDTYESYSYVVSTE